MQNDEKFIMKRFFLLFFAIALISCEDSFDPTKYQGTWIPDYESVEYEALPHLSFKKDSIRIFDVYDFQTVRKYFVKDDTISIQHKDAWKSCRL